MNNILISHLLEANKKEKNNIKVLLIISFLIGILGLVIIMRLVEVSFPKEKFSLTNKQEIKKIDKKKAVNEYA